MNKTRIRTIAVFTANRSEFGVLVPILKAIRNHPNLKLVLLVSGMHLIKKMGGTKSEIVKEGFKIDKIININQPKETKGGLAVWTGKAIIKLGKIFADTRPDFLVVLGDRYELLAPATAAFLNRIPIAHICGGDITKGGLLDDTVRHVVSRMAGIHFPTTEESKKRLIAMGEEPWRIYKTGEPCIDNLLLKTYPPYKGILKSLGLDNAKPYALCTLHPVSKKDGQNCAAARATFGALAESGIQAIITYPNGDPGSDEIIREIERVKDICGFAVVQSLGYLKYIALLKNASFIIGNSSSGIVESAPLHIPSIILGTRQEGRFYAANILTASFNKDIIKEKIGFVLNDRLFRKTVKNCESFFGKGSCGKNIAHVLSTVPIEDSLIMKKYIFSF